MSPIKWLFAIAAAVLSTTALAQSYPTKPITLVVSFAAGPGTTFHGSSARPAASGAPTTGSRLAVSVSGGRFSLFYCPFAGSVDFDIDRSRGSSEHHGR